MEFLECPGVTEWHSASMINALSSSLLSFLLCLSVRRKSDSRNQLFLFGQFASSPPRHHQNLRSSPLFALVGAQPTSTSRVLLCWLTPTAHGIYQTTTWLAMNPMNLFTVPRHSPGSCDGKELTKSLFLSARSPPNLYQAVGYRVDESPRSPSNKATIFQYRCARSRGTPIGPADWSDPLSDFDCRQSVVMAR